MKYIILILLLSLSGCFSKNEDLDQINRDLQEIEQINKENARKLRAIDCEMGLLVAIKHFKNLLYKKVSQEQFDAAFQECRDIGK